MENIKTNNIISTPNIEGNIGSCTTKVEKVLLEGRFWSSNGLNIATNSCTGEVNIYPYHEVAGGAVALVLIGVFILGVIFASFFSN